MLDHRDHPVDEVVVLSHIPQQAPALSDAELVSFGALLRLGDFLIAQIERFLGLFYLL